MSSKKRTLKFHYFYNNSIGSLLIKLRLSTIFSHVGIEFDTGEFIHSAMLKGTVNETLAEQPYKPLATTSIEVDEEAYLATLEWARAQVGTQYDYKGILGFLFVKQWESKGAYFCSELGRMVFERATAVEVKRYNLITPGQLRLMTDVYKLTN